MKNMLVKKRDNEQTCDHEKEEVTLLLSNK